MRSPLTAPLKLDLAGETTMNTPVMKERVAETPPCHKAGIAGVFYLLTILAGGAFFFVHGRFGLAVDLIVTACYLAVTALFYDLFKPASRSLSTRRILQPRATDCKAPPRVHEELRRTT